MCWSAAASIAMVGLGGVATGFSGTPGRTKGRVADPRILHGDGGIAGRGIFGGRPMWYARKPGNHRGFISPHCFPAISYNCLRDDACSKSGVASIT